MIGKQCRPIRLLAAGTVGRKQCECPLRRRLPSLPRRFRVLPQACAAFLRSDQPVVQPFGSAPQQPDSGCHLFACELLLALAPIRLFCQLLLFAERQLRFAPRYVLFGVSEVEVPPAPEHTTVKLRFPQLFQVRRSYQK